MKIFGRSIRFVMVTFISITMSAAFDYNVDEEPPAEAPAETTAQATATESDAPTNNQTVGSAPAVQKKQKKKPAKKSMKRKPSKATKKATAIKVAAKKKATSHRSSPKLKEQIRLLNEKMDSFDTTNFEEPASILADESDKDKTGFIPIQGTNTVIQFGGYVKADAIYDANQHTGQFSNLPNLRLRKLDNDAVRGSAFTAHAKQTRLSIGTETDTGQGLVLTFIEGDFFGASNEGTTGNFSRSDNSSLNAYNFRIRHAYGSYCFNKNHRIDIGQMWTLFYDPQSTGTTIEFNGPETTAQIRRPQIRYTAKRNCWKMSVSLESGATEYLDVSPAFVGTAANGLTAGSPSLTYNTSQYRRAQNPFVGGFSGDGNQGLPDLVGQVIYDRKNEGHFSIGGMVRELKIKKLATAIPGDTSFAGKRYGYGIALGGRYYVQKKTNIFGQILFGKGIGTYIFGFDGYAAAMDSSKGKMESQFAYGLLLGCEQHWSERWRSNLIVGMARASISSIIPGGKANVIGLDALGNTTILARSGYSISSLFRQLYLNLLWSPVEKFEVGIEYAHFRRDTINGYMGYGNRIQMGAFYRF